MSDHDLAEEARALAQLHDDNSQLETIVESLHALRDDPTALANLSPEQLVAVAKAAQATIDEATSVRLGAVYELGHCLKAMKVQR